ncbi:MAG TPA: cytochrome c [Rhodanobacteraceae bacterium]|nr:cytochrome c [Rhodanobacteraceae bacterium]
MQRRTLIVSLFAATLLFAFGTAGAAGNIAAGKKKAAACEACHGANGNGAAPNYPALAGQYQDYMIQALHEYKDGQRTNAIMNGMAAPLTDQDIDDITAFFASLPSKLSSLHGKVQGAK